MPGTQQQHSAAWHTAAACSGSYTTAAASAHELYSHLVHKYSFVLLFIWQLLLRAQPCVVSACAIPVACLP